MVLLVMIVLPVVVLNGIILVALQLETSTAKVVRLALGSILVSCHIVALGLIMYHLSGIILNLTPADNPSNIPCTITVFLLDFGGAARLVFMATFAVTVYTVIKHSFVTKHKAMYASLIIIAILWALSFLGSAPPFSEVVARILYVDQLLRGPIPTSAASYIYLAFYVLVFGVVSFIVKIVFLAVSVCYVKQRTLSDNRENALTIIHFGFFRMLSITLNIVAQTFPQLMVLLIVVPSAVTPEEYEVIAFEERIYVAYAVISLFLIPTPICMLIFFNRLRPKDAGLTTAEQETGCVDESVPPIDEQQLWHFVLPQIPVNVADSDNPNWPLSEFVDTDYMPAEATDNGMESYCMSSQPRGLAVIINNNIFTGIKLEKREGTDLDAENLYRLFKGLGYDVRLFTDLTAAKMLSTLKQVSQLDHRNVDSLVVCILTHGGVEGQLYGTDEELVPVDMVMKPFNGYNCPTLIGKPKLFLMQARRGGVFDYGVEATDSPYKRAREEGATMDQELSLEEMERATEEMYRMQQKEFEATDGQAVVLPAEADFAVVFATVPGYVSWRNSAFGSWFIKAFVEVMTENVYKRHFLEILTHVNNKVALKFRSRDGNKQITDSNIRLRKFLYFNPPMKF